MNVALVCNPASGGETDDREMEELLADHGAVVVAPEEAERIVVCGGDGTLAPAAELAARHGVPLGVVPTGTANDFARAHGLPEDRAEAVAVALGDVERPVDLGRMDGRPFVNVASAGLAPAAAKRAEPLKNVLGPLAYAAGAAVAGLTEEPLECVVDGHFEGQAWQLMIACTGAFGGGAEIDTADGVLDLVVIEAGPRHELPARGLDLRRGDVDSVRAASFTVRVPADTPFNVDGEVVAAGPVVEFTVEPGAVRLVVAGE